MEAIPRLVLVLTGAVFVCSGCVEEEVDAYSSKSRSSTCMSVEDLKSYYNPLSGTANLNYGAIPCESVELVGGFSEKSYVVLSDVGRYISRINGDGSTAWTYAPEADVYILDLRLVDGRLQFIEFDDVVTIDAETGTETGRQHIGYAVCYDGHVQCVADGVVLLDSQKKIPALYPRDAVIENGIAYVADTIGHRVIAYDIATDQTLWIKESFFPNSVQVSGNQVLVTEEHANRVVALDISDGAKSIVTGCELDIFTNADATVAEISERESSGELTRTDGRSICEGILYSPNFAARQSDGSLLIADTDNHRVLELNSAGELTRELRYFNNPVRVLTLP